MLRRRFSPLHPQYDMGFNGWHVDGDFLNWNRYIYDFSNNQIASIKRKLFHLTDTYVIDVHNKEDVLYALMIVVAMNSPLPLFWRPMEVVSIQWDHPEWEFHLSVSESH